MGKLISFSADYECQQNLLQCFGERQVMHPSLDMELPAKWWMRMKSLKTETMRQGVVKTSVPWTLLLTLSCNSSHYGSSKWRHVISWWSTACFVEWSPESHVRRFARARLSHWEPKASMRIYFTIRGEVSMRRMISRRALDVRKCTCKLSEPNFDVPMVAAKWGEFWLQEIWRSENWLESLIVCLRALAFSRSHLLGRLRSDLLGQLRSHLLVQLRLHLLGRLRSHLLGLLLSHLLGPQPLDHWIAHGLVTEKWGERSCQVCLQAWV